MGIFETTFQPQRIKAYLITNPFNTFPFFATFSSIEDGQQ